MTASAPAPPRARSRGECRRAVGRSRRPAATLSSLTTKVGRERAARSAKRPMPANASTCSTTAGASAGGTASDGTRHATSPGMESGSRLVTTTRTSATSARSCAVARATASSRCSALSSTANVGPSSRSRSTTSSERASRRLRHTERRPECVRDRVVVAVGGQLAPPHTTGEPVREPCCDLGRQS